VSRIGYSNSIAPFADRSARPARSGSPLPRSEDEAGLAYVDRSRCLPWVGQSDWHRCEEHCRHGARRSYSVRRGPDDRRRVENLQEAVHRRGSLRRVRDLRDEVPLTDRAAVLVTSREKPVRRGVREMNSVPVCGYCVRRRVSSIMNQADVLQPEAVLQARRRGGALAASVLFPPLLPAAGGRRSTWRVLAATRRSGAQGGCAGGG